MLLGCTGNDYLLLDILIKPVLKLPCMNAMYYSIVEMGRFPMQCTFSFGTAVSAQKSDLYNDPVESVP